MAPFALNRMNLVREPWLRSGHTELHHKGVRSGFDGRQTLGVSLRSRSSKFPSLAAQATEVMSDPPQLDRQQLEECYKYSLFARCAYADSEDTAKDYLEELVLSDDLEQTRDDLFKGKEKAVRLLRYASPLGFKVGKTEIKTDTEVLLAKLKHGDGHELVMAFRGTEFKLDQFDDLIRDGLTDLKFKMEPVTKIGGLKERRDLEECKVHAGFLTSFNDVVMGTTVGDKVITAPVTDVVDELFPGEEKPVRVVCCGHSLGGALCTLAAFWCKATNEAFQGVDDVRCFAFASPRVGNEAFVKTFNKLVGDSSCYRFTHKNDVVPEVPLAWMGFHHVSRPVFLIEPGQDDYSSYHNNEKLVGSTYAAVLAERTEYTGVPNIDDHDMLYYAKALANVIGLPAKDPQPTGAGLQKAQPHPVHQNEVRANAAFLKFCEAVYSRAKAGFMATGSAEEATGSNGRVMEATVTTGGDKRAAEVAA